MTELLAVLKQRIRSGGPMPVSEYMSTCLLHPQFGFYCRQDPFGRSGSFTTSAEISQMFGEIIGLFFAQVWLDQNSPRKFTLAELGPGRGTLMSDLLRSAQIVDGFQEAANVIFVEHSPELKKRQLALQSKRNIEWVSFASDLPDEPLYLVANEFFDALPIRQYAMLRDSLAEIRVGVYDERLAPGISTIYQGKQHEPMKGIPEADIVEFRPAAEAVIHPITEKIAKFGGVALIIDYGDWGIRGNTLQAVRNHKKVDPFASPGCADISAHVDFKSLAESAGDAAATEMTAQGDFLLRLGLEERARMLSKNLEGPALEEHLAAFERLTNPDEMGNLFKALSLYPRLAPKPPGFAQ